MPSQGIFTERKPSKHKAPSYHSVALLPQIEVSLPRGPGSAQSWTEAEEECGGRASPEGNRWAGWPLCQHFEQPFSFPAKRPTSFPSHLQLPGSLPLPPFCLWVGSEELMDSGGMEAVLLYDWQKDERRLETGVGQLLPSVWWDVTRDGLTHSLLHATLGSGLLFGWLGVGLL